MKTPAKNSASNPTFLICCLCFALVGTSRGATTRTWTGSGIDNSWGTAANWDIGAPVNNDNVAFLGATRLSNTNNLSNLILSGIGFNGSGFTLGGNALTNTGGVMDNAGGNTNAIILNLGANQSFTNFSLLPLVFTGNITNNGFGLSVGGGGPVYINGILGGTNAASLALSGGVTLFDTGTLRLAGVNSFAGGLTINGGSVQLANGAAIPSGAGRGDLTLGASGTLNLNANSQTINGLYGSGLVDNLTGTATYILTVGNNSTNSAGNFSGTIQNTSGSVGLTKINTNVFTLTGANSYTGPTLLSGGTFVLGSSANVGSTARITVSPGALLDVSAVPGGFPISSGPLQTLTAGRSTNGGPADILGSIVNSGTINIRNPAVAGTLTINGGLALNSGTVAFDLANTTTIGGGVNDLIVINGTLGLGSCNILINPLTGSFASGTYTLISNTTTSVSGSAASLTTSLPRGLSATFDSTSQPGNLLVTMAGSSSPANLVWNGGNGGTWDVQLSQNWLNGVNPDYFFYLDSVAFNDAGAAGTTPATVNLFTGVSPGSTTFGNSSAFAYVLSGSGAISGTGPLTINGGGTVTLNTPNNFTGDTIVNNGSTLILGVLSASPHITVYNGSALGNLRLGGGGVFLSDAANDTYQANFNNLIVSAGAGSVSMRNRQSSSPYIYQFNTVSRNGVGGTIDFNNIQSKSASPQVGLLITNTTLVNGILGGFATIFENDWIVPVATGGGSTAYAAAAYQTATTPSSWGALSNVNLSASTSANVQTASINSLKLSAAATVTIDPQQTLTLTSGGLLVPANASGSSTITGGTLMGAASADLIVHQNHAINTLTIGSVIADNTGATALTKSGQGSLILTGNNTYTGPTYINGQTISSGSGTAPGLFQAGTLQLGTGGTSGSISASSGVTNNANLAFNRSDPITFDLPISGKGALKVLAGNVTLTGNNSYSGATIISGTLQVGAGGTSGSVGNSSAITDNGALLFNRSDNVSFAGPIGGTGALTKQGAGKLTLGGTNTYQGATTITAGTLALGSAASVSNSVSIAVGAGATFDVSALSGFALNGGTVNQTISGNGVVTGSVTTVAGTTLVPGTSIGTLSFSNNLTLNGGSFRFEVSTNGYDVIAVAGDLTLSSGTIQLTTLTTLTNGTYRLFRYGGSLTGTAANLAVAGFNQSGSVASLSSATPGEIDLIVTPYIALNLVWQGNGGNNFWDVLTTADWTNSSGVASVFHQNDNAIFDDTSSNLGINLQGALTPSLVTVNSANNYAFQGGGTLAGGSLSKNNGGTLTVLTANTYSGPTVITAGTVQVGDGVTAGALGTGPITDNAILNFNEPVDTTVPSAIDGNGAINHQSPALLALSGNSTFAGTLTINSGIVQVGVGGPSGSLGSGPVVDNVALVFNRTGSVTNSGPITGSGVVSNINAGSVHLTANNSYAGNTVIAAGSIRLGASEVIPNGAGHGDVQLDGGDLVAGTLDLNGFNETINGLSGVTGNALGVVANNAGTATNTLTVGDADAATTFQGRILDNTGAGGKVALTKIGIGTLTLQPGGLGSTYSGGTVISNGVISGGTSTTVNPTMVGAGPVSFFGGTLTLAGFTGSTTPDYGIFPNPLIISISQTGTVNGTCRGGFSSSVTGSGTFNYVARYVRGDVNGNWSAFTGVINVTSQSGTADDFRVNNAAGWPAARMSLGVGVNMYGRVAGATIPIGELSGVGSIVPGSGTAAGQSTVWRVGLLNTTTNFSGAISSDGSGVTVGILKDGSGTWILDGTVQNTYAGMTGVTNGVLVLTNDLVVSPNSTPYDLQSTNAVLDVSLVSGSSLSLSSGQTLMGIGLLRGSVNASGTVAPGRPTGTLTITNTVNLNGTTIIGLNRTNSPNSGRLVATNIFYGATLTITNGGPALVSGDTFVLFSGGLSGSFSATNLPALASGLSWVTTNLNVNGTVSIVGTFIPPKITSFTASGGTSTIAGTGGLPNGSYYVLSSTNVALPLAQWTRLATNSFLGDGAFSYTDAAATNATRFYLVQELLQ
jgi:autotransporter-associated beta strand protein